jgi:hypothetical protein
MTADFIKPTVIDRRYSKTYFAGVTVKSLK